MFDRQFFGTILPEHVRTTASAHPGKVPVIEASGAVRAMLDATDVEGVRVQNLEFDGKGAADTGVLVSGICPGLVIEGVAVRGVKNAAFRMTNASGDGSRLMMCSVSS